jgi:lipopolysaccharide export system permease protein
MFTRADRYVFSELITPFLVSITAFLLMLVGNTLYRYLETILREKWPIVLVTRFLVLNIPTVLVMALPIALTLAVSLAVSRLGRDNEITVLRSAGSPLIRIFLPIYLFGIAVSLLNLFIFEKVTPWAWKEQQNTLAVLDALPSNPADSSRRIVADNYTITFAAAERTKSGQRRIRQIALIENGPTFSPGATQDSYPQITTADYAEYENGVWRLKNVVYHRFDRDGSVQVDAHAADAILVLNVDLINSAGIGQPMTGSFTYTWQELWRQVEMQHRFGNQKLAREYETDAHLKLAFPLQGVLFSFVAPLLTLRFVRSGVFTGILLSLVLVVFTLILLLTLRAVAINGSLPPVVAAWFPLVLFAVGGVVLHRAQE